MWFVEEEEGRLLSLPAKETTLQELRTASSPLARQILRALAERHAYSHQLAKQLKVHEQKIYYHVRQLKKAGLITEERREEIGGGNAKYYRLAAPAYAVLLTKPEPTTSIRAVPPTHKAYLEPFITGGRLNCLLVVGSPDAHGPQMARAKDGSYAIDLALFLGTQLSGRARPVMKLDTELRKEELRENLIIIGGPIVNTLAAMVNHKLLVRFTPDGKRVTSTITKKSYESDETGIIVKTTNPFARDKKILCIAGRRQAGTRSAILAFLTRFEELVAGNAAERRLAARVVEGKDEDSDGIIESLEFRE